MIALLQRVSRAEVKVDGKTLGAIDRGILALVCAEPGDDESIAGRILDRVLGFRIFADGAGKMNLSVEDVRGGLLLVPQFTLAADTSKGMRPSFSSALAPDEARKLFDYLVGIARSRYSDVATGQFGESMQVSLVNDGPVTFWLRVPPRRPNSGTNARS
jgi:D-tyrosyl-tRNA(Tyr) deacylase